MRQRAVSTFLVPVPFHETPSIFVIYCRQLTLCLIDGYVAFFSLAVVGKPIDFKYHSLKQVQLQYSVNISIFILFFFGKKRECFPAVKIYHSLLVVEELMLLPLPFYVHIQIKNYINSIKNLIYQIFSYVIRCFREILDGIFLNKNITDKNIHFEYSLTR